LRLLLVMRRASRECDRENKHWQRRKKSSHPR
jgi:hypothetical protein